MLPPLRASPSGKNQGPFALRRAAPTLSIRGLILSFRMPKALRSFPRAWPAAVWDAGPTRGLGTGESGTRPLTPVCGSG